MIIFPIGSDTYVNFKFIYVTLVSKHDDNVFYTESIDRPGSVGKLAAIFSNTPSLRLETGGTHGFTPPISIPDFLVDFPNAILVQDWSVGV